MDNQHRHIRGYRELGNYEIGQINEIKGLAQATGDLIETLKREGGADERWLAIAKTDLQKAFMCLVRAIAKPESF